MKIHHELPNPQADGAASRRPLVCAIGFFDGFHRGHQSIVRALQRERAPRTRAAVLTFRNHPVSYLRPGSEPALIATLEERVNALARAGVDELFLLPFDGSIASLAPEAFLERVLIERLGIRAMVVGENFRFGAKRSGDVVLARGFLEHRGVRVVAVSNAVDGGERISSTRIRRAIADGDLALADELLGHPYALRGRVELGAGRGHDLGFPTANVAVAGETIVPRDGVYAMVARLDGRDHPGLVSIGTNPTFDGERRTVEAWLRDFRGSIYGEELALHSLRFLREQIRFDDVDTLRAQMRADADAVAYPTLRSPVKGRS